MRQQRRRAPGNTRYGERIAMSHRPYQPSPACRADRFWQRVAIGGPDECWTIPTRNDPTHHLTSWEAERTSCSRIAWELARGPIPDGLWVLHTCDNPPCLNPRHLWLGTALDNNRDAARKGRSQRWPAEHNFSAKLTWQAVDTIRASVLDAKVLAVQFGVTRSTVYDVRNRRHWNDQDREERIG